MGGGGGSAVQPGLEPTSSMRPHLLNQHLHRRQQQRVFVLLCFAYIYTKDSNTLTKDSSNFLCLHPLTKDSSNSAYTHSPKTAGQLSLPTPTLTKDSRTTFFAYTYTDQRQPNNLIMGPFYPFQNTSVSVSGVAGLCVALPGKVASATMGACRAAQWVSLCEVGVVLQLKCLQLLTIF